MAVKDQWADGTFSKADADYLADFFESRLPSAASTTVETTESTSSTSYTNLATLTDSVAITVGPSGIVQVAISAWQKAGSVDADTYVSFTASGANSLPADDARSTGQSTSSGGGSQCTGVFVLTGLNPGGTIFKMKYRVSSSSGGFSNRIISAVAL